MASTSVSALTFLNIGLLPGNVNWNKPFLPPQVAFRSDSLDLLYSIVILSFKDAGLLEGGSGSNAWNSKSYFSYHHSHGAGKLNRRLENYKDIGHCHCSSAKVGQDHKNTLAIRQGRDSALQHRNLETGRWCKRCPRANVNSTTSMN